MKEYLIVGIGGAVGSMARYFSSGYFLHSFPNARFPWGTFFVNLLGCLLIGVCAGMIEKTSHLNAELRLALITGLLGGFTTFSAFSIESLQLFREGAVVLGIIYTVSSVALGILSAYMGLRLLA